MTADLVGRVEELALLEAAFLGDDLSGVVIAGEAGVGKTRLAQAFLARTGRDARTSEWLAATASLSAIPFGVFAHLVPLGSAATDALAVFHAVRNELSTRAPGARTVIGVDDGHLLDESSAALVHHLANTRNAFVVVTVRTGVPAPSAISALWKDGLAERVELQALSIDETTALLGDLVGGEVEPSTVHRLWDRARGNPLFLRELVEVGRSSGAFDGSEARWVWRGPMTTGGRLSELLRERVVASTSEERDALELIAAGEPIDVVALATLVSLDALATLEQRGLVTLESSGARRSIRLSHPLYGEGLRADMGEIRAAQLRQRLADGIEASGARRIGDLLRIATWRLDGGDVLSSATLLTAARQAAELGDRRLSERLARAAVTHGGGVAAKVELGDALYWLDRFEEARAVLEACLQGDDVGDEDRAQVAIRLGSTYFFGFDDASAADDVLARIAETLPAGGLRDEVVGARATIAVYAGHTDEALSMAAPIVADVAGDERARARALHATVFAESIAGRPLLAQQLATAALPLAMSVASEIPTAAGGIVIGGYVAGWIGGDLTSNIDVIEQLYLESLPVAVDELRGTWAHFSGHSSLVRGRASSAVVLLREAVAGLSKQDPGRLLPWAYASLARAYVLTGDTRRARDALDLSQASELTAIQIYAPELHIARAWVSHAEGDPDGARSAAMAAADHARDRGQHGVELLMLHDAARLGSPEARVRVLGVAPTVEGKFAIAIAAHVAALVADDAEGLERAAAEFEEIGADLLAAEAWADAAAGHARGGLAARRLVATTRARACADRCEGAHSEALALLDAPSEVGSLTRREREIAALVARGLSNPEIADRLVVSVRTVHNHLAHVFTKLGISRRSDLGPLFEPAEAPRSEK